MGGIAISMAAEARPGKIKQLIYISAFLLQSGQSLMDIAGQDTASANPAISLGRKWIDVRLIVNFSRLGKSCIPGLKSTSRSLTLIFIDLMFLYASSGSRSNAGLFFFIYIIK